MNKEIEQIKNEIERLLSQKEIGFGDGSAEHGYNCCLLDIKRFIDSLPKEPVNNDFEAFEKKYMKDNKSEIFNFHDRHAGLVDGAQWQKEQMYKQARENLYKKTGGEILLEDTVAFNKGLELGKQLGATGDFQGQ